MDHLLKILGLYIILNEKLCVRLWGIEQNICYGCMYWSRVFSGNMETADISIGVCVGTCTLTYFCHVPYVIVTKYIM